MPDATKRDSDLMIGPSTDRDVVSALNFSERLTADIDAWAEAHGSVRSDAIRQLVKIGIRAEPSSPVVNVIPCDPMEIEDLAVKQIHQLLDPSLTTAERERRIRRLTEGPPEFFGERVRPAKTKKMS